MKTELNRLATLAAILRASVDSPSFLPGRDSDTIRDVASELESLATGAQLGASEEMLNWAMEHTDAGYRVAGVRGVRWLDPRDGEEHLTRGKDYPDAITKAIGECAAIEQSTEAEEPV